MEELISAIFRTVAEALNLQSMFTAKTESESTNKILRYLLMLLVVIIAIGLLVVWIR